MPTPSSLKLAGRASLVLLLGLAPIVSLALPSCTSGDAVCGDARVGGDEECDDGNLIETDDCTSECKKATCGDGYTQAGNGEACDDGADNGDTKPCTSKCLVNVCGDGAPLEGVEECDDGNLSNTDDCLQTCLLATCGDGFVRHTTLLEDPASALEECDDANDANDDNCTTACKKPVCGDGFVQAGNNEACDDGNTVDDDACPTSCQAPVCGDGFVNPATEECDDANPVDTDGCRNDCTLPACGDGVLSQGEECDDGNLIDGDFCSSLCKKTCAGAVVDPPPGSGLYEGSCYIYFDGPLTWQQANCSAFGMHRADIQSLGENDFVKGLLVEAGAADAWIGLTDQAVESAWFFQLDQAGNVLSFPVLQLWDGGEPDNAPAPEADCGILKASTGKWADQDCAETRGFVCEYDYPQ